MIGAFRRANAAVFRGAADPCRTLPPDLSSPPPASPPKIAITLAVQVVTCMIASPCPGNANRKAVSRDLGDGDVSEFVVGGLL